MPFGKFKGQPLSTIPKDYSDWLCRQDGFATKNPALYKFFTEGETATSTPVERETNTAYDDILSTSEEPFRKWWLVAYGERARTLAQPQVIAFLRVALAAWEGCKTQYHIPPRPVITPTTPMLAPPLAHIPAPSASVSERDPLKQKLPVVYDNRDEKINF